MFEHYLMLIYIHMFSYLIVTGWRICIKNDVPLVFYLQLFVGDCIPNVRYLCLFAGSGVQHILYGVLVLFVFVLYLAFYFWLPLRYTLTLIYLREQLFYMR